MRPRIFDGCSTPGCARPHHAGGLCDSHYRAEKRGFRDRTEPGVSHSTKSRNAAPSRPAAALEAKVTYESGMLRRGDEYQMVGVLCPDCHGEEIATAGGYAIRAKDGVGKWCLSDRHPIFDETGRLVQMTRVS